MTSTAMVSRASSPNREHGLLWATGLTIFVVSASLPLISHVTSLLTRCEVVQERAVCTPVGLIHVAPLLILAIGLMYPDWTSLSIAGIEMRREIQRLQSEHEVLSEIVDLLKGLRKLGPREAAVAEEATPSVGDQVELINRASAMLEDISEADIAAPSRRRELAVIADVLHLARNHPDALSSSDLNDILARLEALRRAT